MDELLYGFHPVREALRARRRRLDRLWFRSGSARGDRAELLVLAEKAGVAVEEATALQLERLAAPGSRTQGLLLRVGPIPTLPLSDLLAAGTDAPLLALDGIEDPQNFGAILRVADAAGAAGVLVTERRAPPLGAAVGRASAGALEHVPICRVGNLARALATTREEGFWSLGADPAGTVSLFDLEGRHWKGRLVIVLGAEGAGMRAGIRKQLDHRVQIPMAGRLDSMNVAAAAAVILFEAMRHRRVGE